MSKGIEVPSPWPVVDVEVLAHEAGDVEGDRGAVALGQVGGDGVPADAVVGLEQREIEAVRVVMQRVCGPQPRDARPDDGDFLRHGPAPTGC